MPGNILEIRNLSKTFPSSRRGGTVVRAITDVSFDLREGETLALVGESGSGKSTIGRCIVRLHDPDTGEIVMDDVDLACLSKRDLRRRRKAIQMVFQDPASALNPRMTVGDALREALSLHRPGDTSAGVDGRLHDLMRLIGLRPEHAERYPHQLSGGQKQRIGIGRALAVEPRCLIADEAVSALDVSIQAQIIILLGELKKRLGLSMIFISHDLGVVRYLADRVAVLYLGRLVEVGPAREVFAAPRHPYTEALLAAIPDPARPLDENAILTDPSGPDPRASDQGCVFAPRCRYAINRCREERMPLRDAGADRASACIRQDLYARTNGGIQ